MTLEQAIREIVEICVQLDDHDKSRALGGCLAVILRRSSADTMQRAQFLDEFCDVLRTAVMSDNAHFRQ